MPQIRRPISFPEAVKRLQRRGLLPADLSASQLAKISADIRRVAEFSARVTNEHFLNLAHEVISKIVDPALTGRAPGSYMDKATARLELRKYLQAIGYVPDTGAEGSIKDLASDARLNLIIETRTQMMQGASRYEQSRDAAVLRTFPCEELYRLELRKEPRDWKRRWSENGGKFYGPKDRMIARKDDSIWEKISAFGNPYPPFDYNSGMWTIGVSRREAIALGVIEPGAVIAPKLVKERVDLTAAVGDHNPALINAALESLKKAGIDAIVRDGHIEERQ